MTVAKAWRLGFCCLSAACALGWSQPPLAQECVLYQEGLSWLGSAEVPEAAEWAAFDDGRLLVALSRSGLHLFDVTAPSSPILVKTVSVPGRPMMVAVQGGYAYVAAATGGLQVVNTDPPALAAVVAGLTSLAGASAVSVEGSLLAVARGQYGATLVDISHPLAPVVIQTIAGTFSDVSLSGGRAYLAAGVAGLQVVDVTDPAHPQQLATLAPGEWDGWQYSRGVAAVTVSGGLGWFREDVFYDPDPESSYDTVQMTKTGKLLDLSNPDVPEIAGIAGVAVDHARATIAGSLVYAGLRNGQIGWFDVFDASDPEAPQRVGRLRGAGACNHLAVAPGVVAIAEGEAGLHLYGPEPATAPPATIEILAGGYGATVGGDLALFSLYHAGMGWPGDEPYGTLWWLDLANPTDGKHMLGYRLYGGYGACAMHGPHVLAFCDGGLEVFDMSVPSAFERYGPFAFGYPDFEGFPGDLLVRGDRAFLSAGVNGLLVLDVTDPAAPALTASLPQYGRMTETGGYLYLTQGSQLDIVDVTNPDSPQWERTLPQGFNCVEAVPGRLLGGAWRTLTVFDLSDPTLPTAVGALDLQLPSGSIADILVSGDRAYLAVDGAGLVAVDLSAPTQPRLLGRADVLNASALALHGNRLVVTDGERLYLARPDCADPLPVFLSGFRAEAEEAGVRLTWCVAGAAGPGDFRLLGRRGGDTWEVAWAPDGNGDFVALDGSAQTAGSSDIVYELWHRDASGGWDLVGTLTFQPPLGPARTCLRGVHPNPFNPATEVSFAVSRGQEVRIAVYDLRGREVAVLADRWWPAGEHAVRWDGTDGRGRDARSGVYLVELRGPGVRESRKVALSR